MGTALAVIGVLGLVAAIVLGVVALIRRVRSRPARRTGVGAGGLAAGGLVLLIVGTAILSSGSTTANTPAAAANTITTSPNPTASSSSTTTGTSATATTPPTASPAATTPAAAPAPPPPAPTSSPPAAQTAPPTTAPAQPDRAAAGPAAAAVAALAVKGRAPKTGYSRDAFGPAWADVDANGCDTRNDVLRRDLTATQTVAGTGGCQIATGSLRDPYSGTWITFARGQNTSTAVQIDHVVALSDAWQTGAFTWTPDQREQFANDPLNLLAVQGTLNEAKGDGDAVTWLPPDKTERCAYVARQVAVKTAYALWVTPAEQQATARILGGCPGQTLPTEASAAPPAIDPAAAVAAPAPSPAPRTRTPAPPKATHRPSPPPPSAPTGKLDPRFPTCKAAIAAGYGPYTRGRDPEYDWYRDADHDGIDCEHR